MSRMLLLLCALLPLAAGEPVSHRGGGAEVTLTATATGDGTGVIEAVFTPVAPVQGSPWHFYSLDLPQTGIGEDGVGRPTRVAIAPGQPVTALGPPETDATAHTIELFNTSVPVYPPGPVTLRLPITLPGADATGTATVPVEVHLTYMLCNDQSCLRPVQAQSVRLSVPTAAPGAAVDPPDPPDPGNDAVAPSVDAPAPPPVSAPGADAEVAGSATDGGLAPWLRGVLLALAVAVGVWAIRALRPGADMVSPLAASLRLLLAAGAFSVALALIGSAVTWAASEHRIDWVQPADVAELEDAIAAAHATDRAAVLDFTGPSCLNCQVMAKTVFVLPSVAAAWNAAVPIEVDTDPPHDDLAAYQKRRFGTEARPLYVRLEPDGQATLWNEMVDPGDAAAVAAFVAFLRGDAAGVGGRGDAVAGIAEEGWIGFLLLALAGGLFTLVMPCTYPMIPFTISFFGKQAAAGRRLVPLAGCYSGGIIAFFVGIGVVVAGVFDASVASLAGHPVTNLLIGGLFVALGLSLLGAYFLRLPASWAQRVGSGRSGYLGALAMGLTFAITAFTCTAPFAGFVLAAAATGGSWAAAVIGMAVYASVIAVPFFVLAVAPRALERLPRAGAWMGEFKVVGGLVEIAAAGKFLAITDYAWGVGVVGRTTTLATWSVVAAVCAVYLIGWLRMPEDPRLTRRSLPRLLVAGVFALLATWLLGGLFGEHLGWFESFFPGDQAPAR